MLDDGRQFQNEQFRSDQRDSQNDPLRVETGRCKWKARVSRTNCAATSGGRSNGLLRTVMLQKIGSAWACGSVPSVHANETAPAGGIPGPSSATRTGGDGAQSHPYNSGARIQFLSAAERGAGAPADASLSFAGRMDPPDYIPQRVQARPIRGKLAAHDCPSVMRQPSRDIRQCCSDNRLKRFDFFHSGNHFRQHPL